MTSRTTSGARSLDGIRKGRAASSTAVYVVGGATEEVNATVVDDADADALVLVIVDMPVCDCGELDILPLLLWLLLLPLPLLFMLLLPPAAFAANASSFVAFADISNNSAMDRDTPPTYGERDCGDSTPDAVLLGSLR